MNERSFWLLVGLWGCGEDHTLIAAAKAAVPPASSVIVTSGSATPSTPAASTPSASAASVSTPGASGSASAPVPAKPKKLHENPPSDEKSKAPTLADWAKAERVLPFRDTDHNCTMKRVREWVQVYCAHWPFGASLVTGDRGGVSFRDVTEGDTTGTYLTFPVRRGDRRVFLLFSQSKWSGTPSMHLSEQWLEGDVGPIVGFY